MTSEHGQVRFGASLADLLKYRGRALRPEGLERLAEFFAEVLAGDEGGEQ